jgi:serine/threonine-protein kinase
VLSGAIGSGGCATVHLGRLISEAGFSRIVAVKRLLSEYSEDPEIVAMFLDEARLVARIHHPNVVQSFDVFWSDGHGRRELFMVMEYVAGETLSRLVSKYASRREEAPLRVVLAILCDILRGLHAAHNAKSVTGEPLGLIHRDVSPQNVIVGVHGIARLLDFGIAKAAGRQHTTRQGDFKGKASYMAPEQILGGATKLSDVYAASVVLWEAITTQRLFRGENQAAVLHKVITSDVPRPSALVSGVPPAIDAIVMRGLSRDPEMRFPSAEAMAEAIEQAAATACPSEVGAWVRHLAHDELQARAAQVAVIEAMDAATLVRLATDNAMRATPIDPITRVERAEAVTPVLGARARRRRPMVIAIAMLGLLATAVLSGRFLGRAVTAAHADRPLSALVRPVGPPASPAATTAAAPLAPADIALQPAPGADRARIGPQAAIGPLPPAHGPTPASPRPRGPSPSSRAECSPPFSLDSAGRTHFKTECL